MDFFTAFKNLESVIIDTCGAKRSAVTHCSKKNVEIEYPQKIITYTVRSINETIKNI